MESPPHCGRQSSDDQDIDLNDLVRKNLLSDLDVVSNNAEPTIDDAELKLAEDVLRFDETSAKLDDSTPEHVKVYLRIRPLTDEERARGLDEGCINVESEKTVVVNAPRQSHAFRSSTYGLIRQRQRFSFTRVFPAETTQRQFFDETVRSTVNEFVAGQNCLVFSYGVTNSGKTYTIQGDVKRDGGGIIPRALDVIFGSVAGRQLSTMTFKPIMFGDVARLNAEQIEREQTLKDAVLRTQITGSRENLGEKGKKLSDPKPDSEPEIKVLNEEDVVVLKTNSGPDGNEAAPMSDDSLESRHSILPEPSVKQSSSVRFSVWASFVEIYNEQVHDLLAPVDNSLHKPTKRIALQLRDDKEGRPYVRGLREIMLSTPDEARRLLEIGRQNLHVASTRLNRASSRSHCIFTLRIVQVVDTPTPTMARVASLSFCDLAGSERYQATCSYNERVKEGGNINSSLLTLGRCIDALRQNQARKNQSFMPATPAAVVPPTPQSSRKEQVAPFRESKLTRLFQSFLCGEGRVSMVINVSQCSDIFDETLHALKYSALARQVIVQPSTGISNNASTRLISSATPAAAKARKVSTAGKRHLPATTHTVTAEKKCRTTELAPQSEREERCEVTLFESAPSAAFSAPQQEADTEREMKGELSEDDESDSDEESEMPAQWQEEKEKLIGLLRELQAAYEAERKSKATLEMRIRNEVCTEMGKQLVRIESEYQEGLRAREELVEEKYERKMEIYKEALQKSCKRQRRADNDDEYVRGAELHSARMKIAEYETTIKDLELQIKEMEKELAEVRDSFRIVSRERDEVTQRLTKAEFLASDTELKLETAQADMRLSQVTAASANTEASREIEQLHARVLELEKQLSTKGQKHSEVEELMARLKDMESRHEMTCRQLRRDKSLLEKQLSEVEKKQTEHQQETVQTESSTSAKNIDKLETEVCELNVKLAEEQMKTASLQQRLDSFEASAKKMEQDWEEHCRQLESVKEDRCSELERQVRASEQAKLAVEKRLAEMEIIVQCSKEELASHGDCEKKAESLRDEISKLKTSLETACLKLSSAEKEAGEYSSRQELLEEQIGELKSTVEKLSSNLEAAEHKLEERSSELVDKSSELETLREQASSRKDLDKVRNDLTVAVEETRKLKQTVEELSVKLLTAESAVDQEIAKALVTTAEHESQMAKLQKAISKTEGEKQDLETQIAVHLAAIDAYKKKVEAVKNEVDLMKDQVAKGDARELELRAQLKSSMQVATDLREDKKRLAADLDEALKRASEVESHRTSAEKAKAELDRARDEHQAKMKELEAALEQKEHTLQTRYETINDLVEKMEKERADYEVALRDARSNEAVIERLKFTVSEQELTMQMQDSTLHDRCLELKSLEDQLSGTQAELVKLRAESKDCATKREQELSKQLVAEREHVEQKTTHIKELERDLKKLEKAKLCVEKDYQDAVAELKSCEKNLAERTKELGTVQSELERAKNAETSKKDLAKDLIKRDAELLSLREQNGSLQEEVKRLQQERSEKEQNMEKWRSERDKLVTQLDKVIKEQSSEKQLNETEVKNLKQKVGELERVVNIKDQTISDLREQHQHLQKQFDGPNTEDTAQRGARRSRLPKSKQPLQSAENTADMSMGVLAEAGTAIDLDECSRAPAKKTSKKSTALANTEFNFDLVDQLHSTPHKKGAKAVKVVGVISPLPATTENAPPVEPVGLEKMPPSGDAARLSTATRGRRRRQYFDETTVVPESPLEEQAAATTGRQLRSRRN